MGGDTGGGAVRRNNAEGWGRCLGLVGVFFLVLGYRYIYVCEAFL